MITYLAHSYIDKNKWDDCISKSPNGMVYSYSWYLDLACADWDGLIEDDYTSVFPLTRNKKFGIEYLFPPFFVQQLGLFSKNKITEKKFNQFLMSIPEKFRFIEINLNTENNFDSPGFVQKKNLTHHLNLNAEYQSIYKGYSENLKRNLKKAAKFNQQINYNVHPEVIIKLFRNNRGKGVDNLKNKHYKTFLKIIDTAIQKSNVEIYGIQSSNLIAGAIFLESNGKAIFIFSGINKEGKERLSMPLIIDTFIKEHAEKKLILDFEGSNDLNLARFYRGFGAEEKVYLQIKKNNLPFPVNWIKK